MAGLALSYCRKECRSSHPPTLKHHLKQKRKRIKPLNKLDPSSRLSLSLRLNLEARRDPPREQIPPTWFYMVQVCKRCQHGTQYLQKVLMMVLLLMVVEMGKCCAYMLANVCGSETIGANGIVSLKCLANRIGYGTIWGRRKTKGHGQQQTKS